MQNDIDIVGWEHKGLVTGAEARAILSYSDETLRKMTRDGVLVRVGHRYSVASIKRIVSGEVQWPASESPDAKKAPVPIPMTRKRSGTSGRSNTKAKGTASEIKAKKRRGFGLKP